MRMDRSAPLPAAASEGPAGIAPAPAAVDEQSIHSASFVIPFSTFIIIEKDTPLSQKFRITPYVEDIFAYRLSERSVFKNTTIFIKASRIC